MTTPTISPKHKAITEYYQRLTEYHHQHIEHELAVRQAFFSLLEAIAKTVQWTAIYEYGLPQSRRRIDGALFDEFRIPRGYWEAKDTKDDLETEITKKIAVGYPLHNTIFEDTRRAVLYQNGHRTHEADLSKPNELADLLNRFFSHTEPHIDDFHKAVGTFQQRIPELADALLQRIDQELHSTNKPFKEAFDRFYETCKQALNPNLSIDAVKEMLVQHLLTERLFRTIFNNPDFTNRNIIAAEIERVIHALTSREFSRTKFLASLDYFYQAIEGAAATITEFIEKQHFLNTVYERFFQGFSIKQADTHGIVYTPQEIVNFMCASVDAVLQREFGKELSSEGVCILDPCVGTGNFMVNIINRLNRRNLQYKYEHELFCNEVMLLPYYIASLNIEHAFYELHGQYMPFDGICFADTLDMVEGHNSSFFTQANAERVQRQQEATITVIIGNPPYNVGQVNENDNNKNRKYESVDKRIRETYIKDSTAPMNTKQYDMYVRFFRWAIDRLRDEDGIVCFVTNNGFLNGIAFDGMRKHLADEFTSIYHLDCKGNARTSGERRKKEGGNIFSDQIRVGVGITLLVRNNKRVEHNIFYHCVSDYWSASKKQQYLASFTSVDDVKWQQLVVDTKHTWLTQGFDVSFDTYMLMGSKEAKASKQDAEDTIFKTFSLGVITSRDMLVFAFQHDLVASRAKTYIEIYNTTVDRFKRTEEGTDHLSLIDITDTRIKWSRQVKLSLKKCEYSQFNKNNVRNALYRPFTRQILYFDDFWNEERYQQHHIFPTKSTEKENIAICVNGIGNNKPSQVLVVSIIPCHDMLEKTQCFPFYTYNEDGTNRQENITAWALAQFRTHYSDASIDTWAIFYYIYAVLHHPTYRERFADNLRRELPRIPMLGDGATFTTLAALGKQLATLHLTYEQAPEYPLQWHENRDVQWTWRVQKMKRSNDKRSVVVNECLTLSGIPAACDEYKLGNRSALDWVIDQYQVTTDKRSGITNDPNRDDDAEYIVRLVGRVVHISVETVRIVGEIARAVVVG